MMNEENKNLEPETPANSEKVEGTTTPVEPEAPATPTEPEAPATPVEPEAPATPVEPEAPATPVEPEAPATPVEPEAPATPVEPEAPATPVEPEAPATPVEPEAPATPTEPEATATPVEPTPQEGDVPPSLPPNTQMIDPNPQEEEKKPFNKGLLLIILLIVVGLIATFLYFTKGPGGKKDVDGVSIEAVTEKSFVLTGEAVIKGLEDFSPEEVKSNFTISPEIDYSITQTDNKEYLLTLVKPRNVAYVGAFVYTDKEGASRKEVFTINGPQLVVQAVSKEVAYDQGIILRFNQEVDLDSLNKALTIEPKSNHTLYYTDDTNTFVSLDPVTKWEKSSPLTLYISNDYKSVDGKEFLNDQALTIAIGEYQGDWENRVFVEFDAPSQILFHNDDNFILTEDVDPVLTFTAEKIEKDVPVSVEVYRLGEPEKFKTQSHIYLDYDISLTGLEKIDTNAYLLKQGVNPLVVPNPGAGTYIMSATYKEPSTGEEVEVRTGYLVTPYSLYVQASQRESLVWLNDGQLGGPAAGFTIQFEDGRTGVTDGDGLAVIPHDEPENPTGSNRSYYNVTPYARDRLFPNAQLSILDPTGKLVYYDDATLRNEKPIPIENFYSTLYLDRSIYRPEDTISFWGFVRPHARNEIPLPSEVTVVLDRGGLNIEKVVPIDAHGVYIGEIDIEQIRSAGYSIDAYLTYPKADAPPEEVATEQSGDTTTPKDPTTQEGAEETSIEYNLNSSYISVQAFEKPTYMINTKVDKDYYLMDEDVTVTITPTFYDGTPLPNYPLEISYSNQYYGDWTELPPLTTDSQGVATFTFPPMGDVDTYYSGEYLSQGYFRVLIASDGQNINHVNSYNYIPTDIITTQEIVKSSSGDNLDLNFAAYALDLSTPEFQASLKEALDKDYIFEAFYPDKIVKNALGAPVDVDVDLGIRWRYFDTDNRLHDNRRYNEAGSYLFFENAYSLDFKEQEVDPEKVLDMWEIQEKQISAKTENGKLTVTQIISLRDAVSIDFNQNLSARIGIGYKDGQGHERTDYAYYPDYSPYWDVRDDTEDSATKGFTYEVTDLATGESLTPPEDYYRYVEMNADTTAHFNLLLNGEKVTRENGKILYTIMQGGLTEYKIINANEFDFTYALEYGPNVQIVASYFDGVRTHYIEDLEVKINRDSLGLTLEVSPDKESYKPGESVELKIKATNYLGEGVAGNLVVSVVDESIFALGEQYTSTVSDIYSSFWYMDNYVTKYCTTYRSGGANTNVWSGGKGDGGSDMYSYRSRFKDTALFIATRTDAEGFATVNFTLPDNTTSWRITTVEVSDRLQGGEGKTNIISTLPFFVSPVMTSKYIEGDEISLLVQGHGVLVKEDTTMDYSVTITGDGLEETLTATGKAYQPWEFNFGKLPVGEYWVESTASIDGHTDTVALPLYVITSNLELTVNRPAQFTPDGKLDLKAARYPVTLTLYDKEHEAYMSNLNSLLGHYCMMPSQRMSRLVAKRAIRDSVKGGTLPHYLEDTKESIADLQASSGGISPYRGEPEEPLLSAYMALIGPEFLNPPMLTEYLKATVQAPSSVTPKEVASAYLGLAALGETDVKTIEKLLTQPELPLDHKAYYIAALAYLGETEKASTLYTKELQGHLAGLSTRAVTPYHRVTAADLDWERDTAAIWVAASLLNEDDADMLALYFSSTPWRYRTLFEAMVYTTNYTQLIEQKSFSYTLNGETVDAQLDLSGLYTLTLSKSDLDSLTVHNLPENIIATTYYTGEPSELDLETSDNLKVSKEVVEVDDNTYEVRITLELGKDAPSGVYDISDWIPSNARLYKFGSSNAYMWNEEQKLYIRYWVNSAQRGGSTANENTVTFTYQIRQTYQSEAMLDTVYVIHGETGANTHSEKEVFKPSNSSFTLPMKHIDDKKSTTGPTTQTDKTDDKDKKESTEKK